MIRSKKVFDFQQESPSKVTFFCDRTLYGKDVVAKVLYSLLDRFLCDRRMKSPEIEQIKLKKKEGCFNLSELKDLEQELNQKFIDFNLRQIIQNETREIRSILYIKAFANQDTKTYIQKDKE